MTLTDFITVVMSAPCVCAHFWLCHTHNMAAAVFIGLASNTRRNQLRIKIYLEKLTSQDIQKVSVTDRQVMVRNVLLWSKNYLYLYNLKVFWEGLPERSRMLIIISIYNSLRHMHTKYSE